MSSVVEEFQSKFTATLAEALHFLDKNASANKKTEAFRETLLEFNKLLKENGSELNDNLSKWIERAETEYQEALEEQTYHITRGQSIRRVYKLFKEANADVLDRKPEPICEEPIISTDDEQLKVEESEEPAESQLNDILMQLKDITEGRKDAEEKINTLFVLLSDLVAQVKGLAKDNTGITAKLKHLTDLTVELKDITQKNFYPPTVDITKEKRAAFDDAKNKNETLKLITTCFDEWKSAYPSTKLDMYFERHLEHINTELLLECALELSQVSAVKTIVDFRCIDNKWSLILTGAIKQWQEEVALKIATVD